MKDNYPIQFEVDYPERELDRVKTLFRWILVIPIAIVLGLVGGGLEMSGTEGEGVRTVLGAGGLLFFGPLVMIVVRQKYPKWWFDWNLALARFLNRVWAYVALLDDHYPSTDEEQAVHLDMPYPDAKQGLNRWMPLVKWFLAIPHYFVLAFLMIAALFAVMIAWVAILFTGHYPRPLFDFVVGVMRWQNRVVGYAFLLVTDEYPPFRLHDAAAAA